jgi:hypothetical protein
MAGKDDFLGVATARLTALIADQERLLEVIHREKTELVRMDPVAPLCLPTPTQLR